MTSLCIDKLASWKILTEPLFVIAGPCSAESEEQIIQTAEALAPFGVSAMRAGVWKPRTRFNTFQGVGPEALKWLQAAREKTGTRVAVEVARPDHVELCLEAEIDILWIGARSTVNPFSVQAVADALRGVDIPVMVKNPIHPDIDMWIGAFERLHAAGIRKLAAVHRGFCTYRKSPYRYEPVWEIPLELRKRIPGIPMLCDPSHICGNTDLLLSVIEHALCYQYDGLMIETHNNPVEALSDANQQITPVQFGEIMHRIRSSKPLSSIKLAARHWEEIQQIDENIIELLIKRMMLYNSYETENYSSQVPSKKWASIPINNLNKSKNRVLLERLLFDLYENIHDIRHALP